MPELETLIERWRARLTAALPGQPDVVRELEEHLRDAIAERQRRGAAPAEAFSQAAAELGDLRVVARELQRARSRGFGAARSWERALAYVAGSLGLGGGMYFVVALSWFLTRVLNAKPGNPHHPAMPGYWGFHAFLMIILCVLAVRASGRFLRHAARAEARSVVAFFLFAAWLLGGNLLAVTRFSYATKVWALLAALGGMLALWRGWTTMVVRRDYPAMTRP